MIVMCGGGKVPLTHSFSLINSF